MGRIRRFGEIYLAIHVIEEPLVRVRLETLRPASLTGVKLFRRKVIDDVPVSVAFPDFFESLFFRASDPSHMKFSKLGVEVEPAGRNQAVP